jgi:hypothetical protein
MTVGWSLGGRKTSVAQIARLHRDGSSGRVHTLPGARRKTFLRELVAGSDGRITAFTADRHILFGAQYHMTRERK